MLSLQFALLLGCRCSDFASDLKALKASQKIAVPGEQVLLSWHSNVFLAFSLGGEHWCTESENNKKKKKYEIYSSSVCLSEKSTFMLKLQMCS